MTPKLIQLTNLPRVMLVTLPEGDLFTAATIGIGGGECCTSIQDVETGKYIHAFDNWRIVAKLTEVTEEWCSKLVFRSKIGKYQDYKYDIKKAKKLDPVGLLNVLLQMSKDTALESFRSAIEAEGWLLKSPPDPECGCSGPAELGICEACDECMEAQQKVISPEHTLILERI